MKNINLNTIIAIILIFFGVTSIINTIGLLDTDELIHVWWPSVVLILPSLFLILTNFKKQIEPTFFAMLIIGALFQLENLDIIDYNIWEIIVPVLLILVGFNLIRKNKNQTINDNFKIDSYFAGNEVVINSDNLTKGNLTAFFGGVEVDLVATAIKKSATIDVSILFGGAEIKIPDDVAIVNRVFCLFGGVEIPKNLPTKTDKTLFIEGFCLFGSLEVKN